MESDWRTCRFGESPEQTLLREVEEEACIKINDPKFLVTTPDDYGLEVWLYMVELDDEQAMNAHLGNEGQEIKFFAPDELRNITLTKSLERYLREYKKEISGNFHYE